MEVVYMPRKFEPISQGDIIGDMKVLCLFRDDKNNRQMMKCKCLVCGRIHDIYEGYLRSRPASSNHGLACSRGLRDKSPKMYDIWLHMKQRVKNKNSNMYANYGQLGIDYDPRYEYYVNFFDDQYAKYTMTVEQYPNERISIDRIDTNRGFWPGNISWSTATMQVRNSSTVREFYAVDPNGKIYLTNNQIQFAARHGLESKHISACLLGKQATTAGWRFKEKNSLFFDMYYDQMAIRELYY